MNAICSVVYIIVDIKTEIIFRLRSLSISFRVFHIIAKYRLLSNVSDQLILRLYLSFTTPLYTIAEWYVCICDVLKLIHIAKRCMK